jgi:hypothetical protein
VLLLDEPDAHLHPTLQEQLLDSLRDIIARTSKQVLIATHSAEILRNAAPSDILHVRSDGRGGHYLSDEKGKVGLLAGLGSDYAPRVDRAKRTKRVLFVEGASDLSILKILAEKLGLDWPSTWVEWRTTRPQKERKQVYLALREEIPDLEVLSLRDRDDEALGAAGADLVDPGSADDGGFHPRRWRRRYIESYLIWPPAIAAATGTSEEDVRSTLTDLHGIAVGATFTDVDPPQALLDVRGKAILKAPGSSVTMGQFDATPYDVAEQMTAESIPVDVKTFLDELRRLAES